MSMLVQCLHYPAPGGAAKMLLVMLPGAGIEAEDFAAQGMVAAVQELGLGVDVIVAQPNLELYLDDAVAEALHGAVMEPALARGYTRIWLLGISLGGMGALLYASAHPGLVEGLILLAPFLGTRGTVAELEQAGGLEAWSARGSAATEPEQRLLLWLQAFVAGAATKPVLYMGYGLHDRFAPGHKILAATLPPAHIAVVPGGHDWTSWTALWQELLARAPFGLDAAAGL